MSKVYPKKTVIIGIDEVGRGSLAGPVCSAATVLDSRYGGQPSKSLITNLKDSKKLSFKTRNFLYEKIIDEKIVFGVGWASVKEIEELNILKATLLSMVRAFEICKKQLCIEMNSLLIKIDGVHSPHEIDGPWQKWLFETETIKNGDNLIKEIAASSIIAKVTRDNLMIKYDKIFPEYFFKQNMGYGTTKHMTALRNFGSCPIHRKTFKPVKNL